MGDGAHIATCMLTVVPIWLYFCHPVFYNQEKLLIILKKRHISQEQLAAHMGTKREAVSRLFTSDDINPTLNTLIELLDALNLTADITIRHAEEGEEPIKVAVELGES